MNITTDQAIHELKMGRAIKIGASAFLHPEFAEKIPANAKLLVTKKRAQALFGKKFTANVEINLKGISLANIQLLIEGKVNKKIAYKTSYD